MATILDLSANQPPSLLASVPPGMVSGVWEFTFRCNQTSAAKYAGGTVVNQTLFDFPASYPNYATMSVFGSGGTCSLQLYLTQGADPLIFVATPISWASALQPVSIVVDTLEGTLTIAGATTGNGVISLGGFAFSFPLGQLGVGRDSGTTRNFDGTFSDVIDASPASMRAIEALDNSNYYSLANPDGSRGTVNVGNVHMQAWVTIRTQDVTSDYRFIYSTEDDGAPHGFTLMVYGANATLAMHSRGTTGDWSNELAITVDMIGRPLHVVGAIDNGTIKLWVDGVRISPDQPLPGPTGYYTVPTQTIAIGKRFDSVDNPLGPSIAVHGISTGNFGNITDAEVVNAHTSGIYARDIVAIPAKTDHLWSARQDKGANTTLLDRVGAHHFARTGLPKFYEEWAAWDELTDSNYYQMAVAGGSLGTVNVGNLHAQCWITIESQSVSSAYRFVYCSEDFNTGSGYGMSVFVYGTNSTLAVHCRGVLGDWSNEYAIPAELVGVPFQVVGIVDNATLRLLVNGAPVTVDQPLPSATGYYALPTVAIAIGKRPNGTGDSVTGDIKVHGVSTGNAVPTTQECYDAYQAGLAAKDIVGIASSKTQHLWSAKQDGSSASSSTDRVGSSAFTRTGQPSYISAVTYALGACVMTPTTSSGTVSVAMGAVGGASMEGLIGSGLVLVGAGLVGAADMAPLSASMAAVVGGTFKLLYTPTGTTYTTQNGEVVTEEGQFVQLTNEVHNRIFLGILRTSSPGDAPIINRPAVELYGSGALSLSGAGTALVGSLLTGAASLAELAGAGTLTTAEATLVGAASLAPLAASGTLTVAGSSVLRPFCVGSHSNEKALYASMVAGGIQRIRMDAEWRQIEPTQGTFTWTATDEAFDEAAARGLEIHLVVGYSTQWASSNPGDSNWSNWAHKQSNESHWANYIQQVFNRYGGRAASWEIWNEPDHDNFLKVGAGGTWAENNFPGETAVNKKRIQYKRMLDIALAQPAVAGKLVTTSGFAEGGGYDAGFVEYLRTQNSSTWLRQFGVANYHAYGYSSYQRLVDQPAHWNSVQSSISWTAEHWITEHGIPQTGVSDADIKTYLIRSYALALQQPNVKKLFWFRAGYDPLHRDLYDNSSNPTAAYYAMQLLSQRWSSPTSIAPFSSGTARGAIATRSGQPQMAILWADSSPVAINAVGLNIATAWNQDGTVISTSTALSNRPVFAQLSDLPDPGVGNALLVNAAGDYLVNAAGDYLYGKQ